MFDNLFIACNSYQSISLAFGSDLAGARIHWRAQTQLRSLGYRLEGSLDGTPQHPERIPYQPTPENITKLKDFLLKSFDKTVFTRSTPFKAMECSPAHTHLKSDATPYATHNPIPVPFHFKEEVKKQLDNDVKDGIIEPVPTREPVV